MKNLLLNIFLTSCLLLSLSTLKTKAQCTSVFPGVAAADCSTGEIQVNNLFLGVDPSCLAAAGGFSFDILTAADDDGTLIFDNIFSMFMGTAPTPFFPGGTHYPNGTGTVDLMVLSTYFSFFGQVSTTDWYDVGPDAIQGTIDDTYAGTTVDPGFVPVFQNAPIIVKFTPGCADPIMPSINGTELATLPVIPCNTQPDATFTVDNLGPVLPGAPVTVISVAADPNGGAYVLSQTTDLVLGDVYSDCTSFSIINTAQYTGMTGDACVQSYQIDIAVLPFPTNGPIIDDYTCIDQIPGITDPTNADGFIWVYEPGATNVYDNCASVDVSGHWTTPDGCNGPIIAGATNPQRCPFPTDNPTVTDNICPNTNGLFAPPADDPLGNFAWVWDVSNPPTYDACLGAQTASGYWEDTECTSLTDPRSVTSSPTQCCPVITNVSGAEVICHNNSATLLSPVTVDDATLLGFGGADWYIGGAPDAGGQVYDAASTELNTSCSPVDVVLTSYAQCACSGVWIAGATYTITVNPAPPIVNPIPGSCGVAASVELICADGVTVLDTKTNPTSPDGLPCAASGIESDPLAAGSWTAAEIEGLLGVPAGSGCYSDATFAEVAADCAYQACPANCPSVATVNGSATICDGDLATKISDWQAAVAADATNAAALLDAITAMTVVYGSNAGATELVAPNGIVATGVHSGADVCIEETQTTYAYLLCYGIDGVAGGGDDSYLLLGTYTLTVNPNTQTPVTPAPSNCTVTLAPICANDVMTVAATPNLTGDALAANFNATTGVYTAQAGDVAGSIDITITNEFSCAPVTYTLATPACPASAPTLSITDPCNCFAGINLDADPENELAQEVITITPGTAPYTVTAVTGLVDATNTPLTAATATALISGTTITAYVPADGVSTYSLTIQDANGLTATISGGPCNACPVPPPCAASPNMQWGH